MAGKHDLHSKIMRRAEFEKVDRALEMAVIDWLQWGEFPERLDKPSLPGLALELIAKRKAICNSLLPLIEALAAQAKAHEALFEWAKRNHEMPGYSEVLLLSELALSSLAGIVGD